MVINTEPSLTFDDVLLEPGHAGFLRSEVDVTTQLAQGIELDIPLASAPMDTVTGSELAIALGRLGGLGFIHRNLTIQDQVHEVSLVKKAGFQVGAAVASSPGFESRVEQLEEAGVDLLVVDTAHGNVLSVLSAISKIKEMGVRAKIVSGNVATADGAKRSIDAGADILRTGMGPGSICTTRIVSGMGVPQLTAIMNTAEVARDYDVSVIADGGITSSGDITKALAAGASAVMLGQMFAGTDEALSLPRWLEAEDVPNRFKSILNGSSKYLFMEYRGMGSAGAMEAGIKASSEDEYHGRSYKKGSVLVPEGVEGLVPAVGSMKDLAAKLVQGLISGMYYTGARTIPELYDKAVFQPITEASLRESHPHDIFVTSNGKS